MNELPLKWQQRIEFFKTFLSPVTKLLIYIFKHPIKSIFWFVKAYIALVLFFVLLVLSLSANANLYDMTDLRAPKSELKYYTECFANKDDKSARVAAAFEGDYAGCKPLWLEHHQIYFDAIAPNSCSIDILGFTGTVLKATVHRKHWSGECQDGVNVSTGDYPNYPRADGQSATEECPPNGSPEHAYPVFDNSTNQTKCAKLLAPKLNDDDCPSLSAGEIPQMYFSTDMNKTQICFQHPTKPDDQCKYEGSNGFFNTPDMGSAETQFCGTKDPDNDLTNPEPDSEGCRETSNGKVCPDNPNDRCKTTTTSVRETSSTGSPDYQLSCDAGCGMIEGEFVCVPDSDESQIEGCNSEHYRLLNPNVCKTDPTKTDKNNDGVTDNKDVVSAINSNNAVSESMLETLNNMSDTLNKSDEKGFESNRMLSSIDSKLGAIDSNVKKISDAMSGDGGELTPFAPELSEKLKVQSNDWQTKNFYTVTNDFINGAKNGALYSSVDNFFKVSFSGTCPVYTANLDSFGTVTLDQWCSPAMGQVWPWIEAIILLIFGFMAFREAFL